MVYAFADYLALHADGGLVLLFSAIGACICLALAYVSSLGCAAKHHRLCHEREGWVRQGA